MKEKNDFKPFIPADKVIPEFTVTAIIIGVILSIVFGAANAYLGLRVGMTVSASIPAAVISMGIIRVILRKDSILENNMVQTIASAGESLAAGAIFTMPALFLWAAEWGTAKPTLITIGLVALVGGVLGTLFMIPLRSALIVQEHGTLPYPEGTACAEVLVAGEQGGAKAGTVFAGLGIAAVYKFIADGIKLFPSEVHYEIPAYKGSGIGMDVLPALAGVGYICGPKISSYMLTGAILAWFVLMPLIHLFGGDVVMYPGTVAISTMDSFTIWKSYIKYIGAGAVATGGIISLIKSLPLIIRAFKASFKVYGKGGKGLLRTEQDISIKVIIVAIAVIAVFMWVVPVIPLNLFGAIIVIVFGFFFATVSSRMVGLVGSSNNPVSGMAIATLLVSCILLKATGNAGHEGMVSAIIIGSIICIVAAMAGDISQDLKTGYLVGATPKKQQIGEIIGSVAAAITIGAVLYLLDYVWGFESTEIPAPQANLMKIVVEGVMGGNLPWTLVFAGAGIAIFVEILGIPVLPFAIGLYLPIHLSTPIMVGGLVRLYMDKRKGVSDQERKASVDSGVLYTSGLIAGEGVIGILIALLTAIPVGAESNVAEQLDVSKIFNFSPNVGNIIGLVFFALLVLSIFKFTIWRKDKVQPNKVNINK